ncbi:GIY-YIG nuclease family protein [Polaromonas sp.]|uniref:GIY-YIG nuclease family protein n=1 Tax=Polaromonas sp. TaxID=1869339 RepID=UPI00356A146D
MSIDINFRKRAVGKLPTDIGVYVLCDLDEIPIYVGQSTDGIRRRVGRHLTSARSDIIANRQIDVWEIAYVWAYPTPREEIAALEAQLFHHFDSKSKLMNGTIPQKAKRGKVPNPFFRVQVMPDEELKNKKDPAQRLPRQAAHYAQIVGHFLDVKNSRQIARAMTSHFVRLQKYHDQLLRAATEAPEGDGDS